MAQRSSVLLIYTGGTIGMAKDEQSGLLKPVNFDHLLSLVPEVRQIDCELSTMSFDTPIDSSNMSPEIWGALAQLIATHYDNYDGFVILHGSDTMAFTASALCFMLQGLNKPVILTGSQLPIGIIRTDGKENIITAIEIAAAKKNGLPLVPEVAIYFEYRLYRGSRTYKSNAAHFDAFHSPNYPELAEAGVHINYNHTAIRKPDSRPLNLCLKFEPNIVILKLFPGITQEVVTAIFNIEGLKGVILETYGSGNAPNQPWFLSCVSNALAKGLVLVNITQCTSGAVESGRYETTSELNKTAVINGHDMTTEASLAKLMYLLGSCHSREAIKKGFETSICGEVTIPASNE